ncbi:hydrolase [Planctomicrobium sp. SH664]|uniref:hydrolase n=1 Tax=Planctomicrobium sp. SH664 TaxID=3448125 RepID=UPI003F5B1CE8
MTSAYEPYLSWIDAQQPTLVDLLCRWSNINTGTLNLEGINRLLPLLSSSFADLGTVTLHDSAAHEIIDAGGRLVALPLGRNLRVQCRPRAPLQVLLAIHLDTVYGPDSPFHSVKMLDSNTLNGPGVTDAKGGLVVMLAALTAFERFVAAKKKKRLGWQVIVNSDEEIGSPGSTPLFQKVAGQVQLGLLFEPALPNGNLVSSRKGAGNFSIVVRGRSAHAGRDFEQGRNAIAAAARIASLLDGLNGTWEGVTLNVARIDGGGPLNIVPDLAVVRWNVRCTDRQHEQLVLDAVQQILAGQKWSDGLSAEVHGAFTAPPKIVNEPASELLQGLIHCGHELGLELSSEASGGVCDGNRLAACGVPNVDTLGVRGGKIHSHEEFVLLDSLPERARLTALFLMRLADGTLELPFLQAASR